MSEIKEKIEMELKPYETMCEQTTEHLKQMITGSGDFAAEEILSVAKTLGEITDIKKDIVEMCYKKYILKAMEENEDDYGETWNEDGLMRKGYRGYLRDSKGRFRRGYDPVYMMDAEMYKKDTPEHYRDMDRNQGKMYYTEATNMSNGSRNMRDYREGRSGMSRRSYMESKERHAEDTAENKLKRAKEFETRMDDLYADLKEEVKGMSNEEKTVWKNKIAKITQLIP